jgi:hypothetical protein
VCYCCKTALATGANGEVYVAWRHVYAGNLRDIAFARSVDGGRNFTPPTRVSEDGWILEGCPDDGPAIAVTARDRVHVVWPTLISDGEGRESIGLFYAATKVASLAFSRRTQLPTEGLAHHPQVATGADGTLFVAWDEAVAGARRAVVARARPGSDVPDFVRTVVSDGRPAVYPAIAVAGSTAVVAWTANRGESSVIGVSTLANESR